MKLSDYAVDFLIRHGLRRIFLLPGGGCMHLTDAVGKRPELDYVCCLHEQACAFAAEAYGEYTNAFGCALVTAGPGGTNAITGAACAWIESSPCLFLSGQAKRTDLISSQPLPVRSMGQQEVDIAAMVRPVTKYAVTVLEPAEIRFHLEKALWLATHGRKGPVWLDIPLDVQAAQVDPAAMTGFTPPPEETRSFAPGITRALEALARARRPVIYAGNGVRTAGMIDAFRALVERLHLPVLLTWKAADFLPEDHPCYAGRPGGIGQRAANFTQQKADWMLVLGARLDLPSVAFNHANFAPRAFKVFVDVDPAELAKFKAKIDVPVCADLRRFLTELLSGATARSWPDFKDWSGRCRGWMQRFPVVLPAYRKQPAGPVSTYVLMDVLSELLGPEDVIVPGSSGPCSDIFYQAFRIKAGQRILNAPGLGAMGTGLPGSIGAALAAGGRRVVNINGEGGFQLNIQELETVRRLGLPIKFIVLDNGGYRSVVTMQRSHFQGRLVGAEPSSRLTMPDTGRVAAAYGIPALSVDSHDRLRDALAEALARPGPVVCVVKTSVDEMTAPRAISEVRPDGTIVSKPMEDMWPFLDRAEFNAIMAE
ncbi:MAG: thiamine pyrophosphate-binding protein [Opitutaceae bacterium]|nr:thiamine pyrophosphate-binding protein [Opitutaceae bacterium]